MKHHILLVVLLGALIVLGASTETRTKRATGTSRPGYNSKGRMAGSNSNSGGSSSSSSEQTLLSKLLLAPLSGFRYELLDKDSDFTFNFQGTNAKSTPAGNGGNIILANRYTFPAVTGLGVSMAIGFIGPCGMNTPHFHPRATEFNFVVNGSMETGFIAEDGFRIVRNTVPGGTGTVFPAASIHWLANLGCDPVVFVGGFNSEDPGVTTIAQNLFKIDEDVLTATLGGTDWNTVQQIASGIPADVALGLQSCLKKCGMSGPHSGSGGYSGGY